MGETTVAELHLSEGYLDCAIVEENLAHLPPKLILEARTSAPKSAQLRSAIGYRRLAEMSPRRGCGLRKWRRVRRELCDNALGLNVDFLVLATGNSLGIVSKDHGHCTRKRIRARDFGARRRVRRTHRGVFRDKGEVPNVESELETSDAGDVFSNQKHSVISMSYDGEHSEDRQSEEVQSEFKKDNGSDDDYVRGNFDMDQAEECNEESEWSFLPQDDDPLIESISALQTTQKVLESEMQKLSELGKESEIEDPVGENKDDVFAMPDVEVDVLELNQKMEHLEQKLKEASATIREKDLRLMELQRLLSSTQLPKLQMDDTYNNPLELELEHRMKEKIEAEIQCLVMGKASQSWRVQADDWIAFMEEDKLLAGGNSKMMLTLQDTENKVLVLKEQVEKLEVHEKELFGTTEVLKMQNRFFRISVVSFIQFIMVCISLWIFFRELPLRPIQVVPT